jgi:hypothetical protein
MYGNTKYNATEKAFEFDGTDDMLDIPVPRHMLGDPEATVSIWVKPTLLATAGSDWDMFAHVGRNVANAQFQLTYNGSLKFHLGGYGQNLRITGDYPLTVGTWYHLCMTVNPGAWSTTTKKLYINGQQITNTYMELSGTTNIPDHQQSRISFGALRGTGGAIDHESHCKMSNMKVYDTALTSEEVKTLYDMGRCDEGHHTVNFSKTRVGIGLGDGEAPTSTLDVRGTFQGNSPLRFYVLSGIHPSSATTVSVPFNEHLKRGAQIVSFTGSTTTGTNSVVPWNYHNESNQYEIMVYWNKPNQAFTFFGQGTSTFGLPWKMFVVTT